MASSPADGRPRDGEGLPEVGSGSREAQFYTPMASCHLICLLGRLGKMEGGWHWPRNKAKGRGESVCRFLLDTGDLVHCPQRRAREVSSEWFSMRMTCVLTLEELVAAGFLSDLDLGHPSGSPSTSEVLPNVSKLSLMLSPSVSGNRRTHSLKQGTWGRFYSRRTRH